ncbi:MAG: thermonuclease family protein, partial [Deltaproteobacteria bacterium]|nr:thermonuclease family protein [Deltaproteobacteria bacterium]
MTITRAEIHIVLILWVGILFSGLSWAGDWRTVRHVNDGDTVVLADGVHVRYIGINTPEISHKDQTAEPYGYAAKKFNERMVLSKKVRLAYDVERHDQYGRLLAYVFLEDGTCVNSALLKEGLAYYLPRKPNMRYDDLFHRLQQDAMSNHTGMWRDWKEEKSAYTGNRRSKRFHLKTCPFGKRISLKNRALFTNRWDAFWAGYAPCKPC